MTSSASSTPTLTLGRIAFEAYGNHPGPYGRWATFDGRPMPGWEELDTESGKLTRERWEVGIMAAIAEHERRTKPQDGLAVGKVSVSLDTSEFQKQVAELAELTESSGVDPFLLGIQEIASATRELAEARRAIALIEGAGHLRALIDDVTKALRARVLDMAAPPST
jgi:hypothetical protein